MQGLCQRNTCTGRRYDVKNKTCRRCRAELTEENNWNGYICKTCYKKLIEEDVDLYIIDLKLCDKCMQMTNHKDGVCQKCKK